ncbi:hypothetical protein EDD86DRAFT_247935 [Gorgonomyces haynaldii]|nr:hypothetical protein EDD86DRAFT_247935 [Gorgonomyces haynaldii]
MLVSIFVSSVSAHGFMVDIQPIRDISQPAVYNYDAISNNIDSLRSPSGNGPLCRGQRGTKSRNLNLVNGQPMTVTSAFSIGAQHIGPCQIEIMQRNKPSTAVVIAQGDCARPPAEGGKLAQTSTYKTSGADAQCPGRIPPNLVTNDMCLNEWTFEVQNADRVRCTDCVLRWTWTAQHISVYEPEFYENCLDVTLSTSNLAPAAVAPAIGPTAAVAQAVAEQIIVKQPLEQAKEKKCRTRSKALKPAECKPGVDLACMGQSYFAFCFPENPDASAVYLKCAEGTSCLQQGLSIACQTV